MENQELKNTWDNQIKTGPLIKSCWKYLAKYQLDLLSPQKENEKRFWGYKNQGIACVRFLGNILDYRGSLIPIQDINERFSLCIQWTAYYNVRACIYSVESSLICWKKTSNTMSGKGKHRNELERIMKAWGNEVMSMRCGKIIPIFLRRLNQ